MKFELEEIKLTENVAHTQKEQYAVILGLHERRSRSRSRKRSGKSVYDLVKIKNQSRKQSHKRS